MWPPNAQTVQDKVPRVGNLRPLAQGGQKVVFKGTHQQHGEVVVKVISAAQPDERTRREIEVATQCRIPNVPQLHEYGTFEYDGATTVYVVEEYVAGMTLRGLLQAQKRLPLPQVLSLLDVLLDTAVALERERLVHRDIKPENIMMCQDGSIRLLDFGIARHLAKTSITPTAARLGPHTAGYAAPEQFRNLKTDIDIRADLFAIGVVAYEALAGGHPFIDGARNQIEVLRRTESVVPAELTIPGDHGNEMNGFIGVLMSKYPSRRPPTALHAREWFQTMRSRLIPGSS